MVFKSSAVEFHACENLLSITVSTKENEISQ